MKVRECASQPTDIDWQSLIVIYIVTVVAEAARGLILPSTWPYFESLGGSKAMLGFLVGIYSFGRMLSVTPLGHMTDKRSSGNVMIVASIIQAVGHLMYAVAPSLTILYLSRALVGFGSATTSVARAHITKAIPSHSRTHHFAYLSGLQFVGIAVLPAFGGLISLLPTYRPLPFLSLDGFTYPAHILVFANLVCAYVIYRYYNDPPRSNPPSPATSPSTSLMENEPTSSTPLVHSARLDRFALIICLLVNLVFRGVLAELETVSIPFLMEQYNITYGAASICLTAIGCLGVLMYFSFKPIARRFSDRILVAVGLVAILIGCVPLSIPMLVKYMGIAVYVLFLAFTWSVAYPIGQTSILSLYSKVLGSVNVGGLMGLFSASGAISPLVLSMVASSLWDAFGRESVFAFVTVLVMAALSLTTWAYRRLVTPCLPF